MDARLQRRVQRYGWDLAAPDYEALWQQQLAPAQRELLRSVAPARGEQLLDVACGTGLASIAAARAVGATGRVCGVDLSGAMVDAAARSARAQGLAQTEFLRMDAEALQFDAASFDVVLCALGLMYVPDPQCALREMHRVLRPGGRLGLAVWGPRSNCGWSGLFEIVQDEVASEVCPLFFQLGQPGALQRVCERAGFEVTQRCVLPTTLAYANADAACRAAFAGGPVALAWSRFDAAARARASARYIDSIAPWKAGEGYRIPAEFALVCAIPRHART